MESEVDQLLHKMIAGDLDAFLTLCRRFGREIGRDVQRKLPAKHSRQLTALDIMSKAYVSAWEKRTTLRRVSIGTFCKWLRRIAHNIRIDEQRALDRHKRGGRNHHVAMGPSTMERQLEARIPSPSAHAVRKEDRQLLGRALRTLRTDHRRVLVMIDLWGYSLAEVAKHTRRTADAVGMLHKRALAALTQAMYAMRSTSTMR